MDQFSYPDNGSCSIRTTPVLSRPSSCGHAKSPVEIFILAKVAVHDIALILLHFVSRRNLSLRSPSQPRHIVAPL